MPAPVLHSGAIVRCAHGGRATPTSAGARVLVADQPVTTVADHYVVEGCPLTPPVESPCVTAIFTTGATRVRVAGAPVLLAGSPAVSAPNGMPLTVVACQSRVTAS
jgi:hypothetical protein